MTQETSERVVEKSVTVSVPVERAFEVFTAEIGTWWPLRTHAVDTERSETVVMGLTDALTFMRRCGKPRLRHGPAATVNRTRRRPEPA